MICHASEAIQRLREALDFDRCDFCRGLYAHAPHEGCPQPTDHDARGSDMRPVAGQTHTNPTHDTNRAKFVHERGSL